jgi:NAD(P)-dependent dehydrogenase (short-subunit alcohol dehydrogenase family)
MNLTLTDRDSALARPLKGKTSLIMGSTSGIGLGIARALAQAGSAIILKGFGKLEEISDTRENLTSEFGVKVEYSAADMANPASIAEIMDGSVDMLVNNASIQHVAPLQEFPVAKMGRDYCHRSEFGLPYNPARPPQDAGQQMGPHLQYCIGAWAGRLSLQIGLRRCETWR